MNPNRVKMWGGPFPEPLEDGFRSGPALFCFDPRSTRDARVAQT